MYIVQHDRQILVAVHATVGAMRVEQYTNSIGLFFYSKLHVINRYNLNQNKKYRVLVSMDETAETTVRNFPSLFSYI